MMTLQEYVQQRIQQLVDAYKFCLDHKASDFQDAEVIFHFGKYTELLRIERNFALKSIKTKTNSESKVYFTREDGTNTWKVGKSISPKERKSALQVGNSRRLYVFASVPGSRKFERMIHNYLEITYPGSRIVMAGNEKEWFNLDLKEMKKVIALLKKHGKDFLQHLD